jgi:Zn-dependent metalloprotease
MQKIFNYFTGSLRPPLMVLLILVSSQVIGQGEHPLGDKFKNIVKPGSTREWVKFWDDSTINASTFFARFKDLLSLTNDDVMHLVKTKKDEMGFKHYRYQQYYKNHRVVFGEYIVHQQPDGLINKANGRIISGMNAGSNFSITEKQAFAGALQFMHAKKYLWQNAVMEKALQQQQKNNRATYFPKGELVYAPDNNDGQFDPSDYRLAWFFKIYTDDPNVAAKDVYVDANTGRVIFSNDISMTCSLGSGTSSYNASVSVYTLLSSGNYYSHNDCQGTDIYVYNCSGGGAVNTLYSDADNSWADKSAAQAMWGAAQTYSYYYGQHARQSWDGSAGDLIAYNNAYLGSNNACWGCTGNSAIFYAGSTSSPTDDWNTNDIMGHEFTHGVTQDEAGLVYNKESGALNESYSDIFGEMVESWSEGNCDYLVGADRGTIRSFINPNAYGDPDTYKGTYWYNTSGCTPSSSNDNCGVHTNSSVQNRWFYLVSEGGSGTNDNGESYNVTGITRFETRLITYRALTEYMFSSAQYIDARKASLEAAYDLYGSCSQEVISVGDAWHAVGVESQSPAFTQNACGNYPANGTWVQAISTTYGGNGCATTITPSASTVYFTARDKVILLPGFTAQSGSNFIAYLEPCSSTRWLTKKDPIMSDAEKGLQHPVSLQNSKDQSQDAASVAINNDVAVTPNPFTSTFTLTVSSKDAVRAQVNIYNASGSVVKRQSGINLVKGVNKISFNCASLSSGVYMLEVDFGNAKAIKKIVKAR